MKRKTVSIGVAVAIGSLAVGAVVGLLLLKLWKRPMAPSLPTLVPTATQGVIATDTPQGSTPEVTEDATEAVTATPTPDVTQTPTAEPMCGGPANMVILTIGTNRGFYDLADVIRVVNVDFVNGEVYIVPLPRDLKVDLPPGITEFPSPQKINEGYFLGTPVWQLGADESGGAALMAQTLAYNFGISVDHYVVVSGEGFRKLVDAVGGVQIYLPVAVKDENQAHADFPAGNQVLDGYHAWLLARVRKNVGDLGRIERQTLIVKALLDRVTSPQILSKLPDLINLYSALVMTDLSPEQMAQLVCLLQKMDNPKEHFHFYSVPRDMLDEQGQFIYIGMEKSPVPQDVLLWDERYKQWLHDALTGKVQP